MLSAIANGNHTRAGIANYLARKSTDLGHALTVLENTGMVTRDPDAFHGKRSSYRIAEPIVNFYHAVMRPEWSDLERPGHVEQVWAGSRQTFLSKVVGPHFEQVCRAWARWYATPDTLGGQRTRVASGTVPDPVAKTGHEVDVAVFGRGDRGHDVLLAVGEAKWNEVMGASQLRRLERIRDLLRARGIDAEGTRLLCFSGAGFTDELRGLAAGTAAVQLVDLERLYHGG